jgi:uncharacterized protein YjbI with pentapeptide repeats
MDETKTAGTTAHAPEQELSAHPYRYVDEDGIDAELRCTVCLQPFVEPVYGDCCGLNYCRECVPKSNRCVSCRGSVQPLEECTRKTHRLLLNALGKLAVYCGTRSDGEAGECSWEGRRDNLDDHLSQCTFRARHETELKARQAAESCLLLNPSPKDVVQLNVRGRRMFASRRALTKQPHSKLAVLFSPHHHLQKDESGSALLDVNPKAFADVLDFLAFRAKPFIGDAARLRTFALTALQLGVFVEDLRGVNFSASDLRNADLSKVDLSGANFTDADLRGVNLAEANLSSVKFTSTNLSGANLTGTRLISARFQNANLSDVNLTETSLTYIEITSCNFSNALLTGGDLSGVGFSKCNLSKAVLRNTNLSRVHFSNADLTDADLTGATIDKTTNFTGATLLRTRLPSASQIIVAQRTTKFAETVVYQ